MVVKGMKFKLKHLTLMSAIALTATTAGLSVPAAVKSQSPSTIKIDGSSTVFPITEAVAEDFQQQRRGAARGYSWCFRYWGGFKSSAVARRTSLTPPDQSRLKRWQPVKGWHSVHRIASGV